MSTNQFKKHDQYKKQMGPPDEDYIYNKWLDDVQLQVRNGNGMIGVALFGVGRAGTIHLTSLLRSSQVKLLYIIEDDQSKWTSLKNYWNLTNIRFLTSDQVDVAYNDENVRAVIVASPTKTHEGIVIRALNHNKAVFCEKPIAESIEKARRCFEKAHQVGQPLLTAFNRRFDAAYSSIRDRVRNGEVGHVSIIKSCSRGAPPSVEYLKVCGGIFHDTAIHDIDTIIWILGEYPVKVQVAANSSFPETKEIGYFDTVAVVLTFASGTIGIIDISLYTNYGYDQRLEVFGFNGMIKDENQHPIEGVEAISGYNKKTCPMYYSFASRYHNAYEKEMEHFLDVVEGKERLKVDYHDVLAVSKIASACDSSARTGNPVKITWFNDELPNSFSCNLNNRENGIN